MLLGYPVSKICHLNEDCHHPDLKSHIKDLEPTYL